MPRTSLPWLILATFVVSALLAWWTLSRSIGGEGPSHLEHRDLAPFHEIEVGGVAAVTLVQSDRESIDVEAAARGIRTSVNVEDGRLVVRARDRRRWWSGIFGRRSTSAPRITVHFRALDVIALGGNVRMDAPKLTATSLRVVASGGAVLSIDDLRASSLRVHGSGALQARLAGRVDNQSVTISGAGSYLAERLVATDASVSVSGVGNVVVHAVRTLDASISGAGIIEYVGNPTVTEHVSGVGRVRRREPANATGLTTAAAGSQCSGDAPWSLKNSAPPVTASTSACMPGMKRTSDTWQSRSSASSIAPTSCTVS